MLGTSSLGEPLYDAGSIAGRVREIGAAISHDYAGSVPLLVGLLSAGAPFLADLSRALTIPCEIDVISVNRYGDGEGIALQKDTVIPVGGRHVVLVDDTVDTGLTLQYVHKVLLARTPASLAVCALLDRPHRRIADIEIRYRGFELPDVYVVGYGLDYLGRYRELPALYAHGTWPA
ncbi:MAG: hypoxanthine phosphoribosyltransferase [Candidatus Eremiobacteraeota bacterium]|nr:hypoxanthine phosphoribosyltransferase [Candidatus Eremiobacteraeota bacterium]MBV8374290.1 hypoxanthine phosphoribosyltransferase [Candidatus Eremiobacteraeota bacterium]